MTLTALRRRDMAGIGDIVSLDGSVVAVVVVDFDDESRQFLILFGDAKPTYKAADPPDSPFELVGGQLPRPAMTHVRPGQQRFRFQVLAQYGCKCAVCSITHASLMKAAHIRGKAHKGSDDWRNGIPLCSTHHDAFDAHLFFIDPDTLAVKMHLEYLLPALVSQRKYLHLFAAARIRRL